MPYIVLPLQQWRHPTADLFRIISIKKINQSKTLCVITCLGLNSRFFVVVKIEQFNKEYNLLSICESVSNCCNL